MRSRVVRADRPLMPQLREDHAARRVHAGDNGAPAPQRRIAMQFGHIGLAERTRAERGGMIDADPFGDDEAHAMFGPAAVIGLHRVRRDAAGRSHARHRRHHDAVAQRHIADGERAKQRAFFVGHGSACRQVRHHAAVTPQGGQWRHLPQGRNGVRPARGANCGVLVQLTIDPPMLLRQSGAQRHQRPGFRLHGLSGAQCEGA